ncbi:putative lin1 family protein [Phaeomoniella chlamydospora]|uniref:Putative lin1 family protein n=1 Tax=Phaeomoniella chlamydospora TaxID=158046 RepID=A0A0G2ERW9_PHACM|nr:putative lin1 family protein [Phaeomoniella chlamydospora]
MARPSGRPKRAGEDFTRTHYEDQEGPATKKPRFDPRNPSALAPDALEEDNMLEMDEIGRRGQQVKRNAVNLDGYDSDSDNENFNARAEARSRKQERSKHEDVSDMFADLEDDFKDGDDDENDDARRGGKKKAVRFLHDDEIEGQVASSKSGGHVSADLTSSAKGKGREEDAESSSESDVDDETRAAIDDDMDEELGAGSKKSHAPKLDAFNMRSEQEDGKFDEQGNYVRKAADADAVYDTWLEGISKRDMKKAAEAAERRDQERRQKDVENDAKLTSDLLATLIRILQRGETGLEALARLGKGTDRKPKWQNKHKNRKKDQNGTNGTEDIEMNETDPAEEKRKAAIETLTDASDLLLGRGQPEIYDTEREMLMRQYRRETGEDWQDPIADEDKEANSAASEPKMWEYRWSDARDGGDIHGPYDGTTMSQWNDAGYFGEDVEFRRAGDQGAWSRLVDFV